MFPSQAWHALFPLTLFPLIKQTFPGYMACIENRDLTALVLTPGSEKNISHFLRKQMNKEIPSQGSGFQPVRQVLQS